MYLFIIVCILNTHTISTCIVFMLLSISFDVRLFFFFFQAEDGIRDYKVTGVQTCALPIWRRKYDRSEKLMRFSTHDWLLRTMAPHKRFIAWQECHKLVIAVYKATENFPKHELYGLTSQARRAAFSGAANIVEGASRKGRNEFRHFLDISLGSLSELEYSLEVAAALEYLEPAVFAALAVQQKRARFFTWKLKNAMR